MDYQRLLEIDKLPFSLEDIADLLGIRRTSAAVLCARYVKKGLLTRLKRDLYVRTEALAHLGPLDLYRIANLLQVPSYVSLMTALSHYGVSTQIQRGFIESIAVKRTKAFDRGGISFRYMRISPELYGGFIREQEAFIASPEKALLDSVYLASMGRYPLDTASLDMSKLDRKKLIRLSANHTSKTRKLLERIHEETSRPREL